MKSNSRRFLTPSDLRRRTVFARFVRWISGMLFGNSSFRYATSVNSR
jgi:hypothetical protein